jgi:DNA-binding NtrC family response regulator
MSGARVVLVDDDERLAELVAGLLKDGGYDVVAIENTAESGLEAVIDLRADAAVIDLVLPDGDGLSIADEVRRQSPETAVVVYSSLFDLATARRASRLGVAYVEKAKGLAELELQIEEALKSVGVEND